MNGVNKIKNTRSKLICNGDMLQLLLLMTGIDCGIVIAIFTHTPRGRNGKKDPPKQSSSLCYVRCIGCLANPMPGWFSWMYLSLIDDSQSRQR